MKFQRTLLAMALSAALPSAWAEAPKSEPTIETMTVMGVRERLYEAGMLKDVIQKTEVITSISIENANAANLTDAIAEAPGVRVNNECSMCGVKRVMLNGMRGEHTNILVDGIPTYTMMSGFYGLDAAASSGIESIEIARGAGASLIAPEAIGGTINLITKEATENGAELEVAAGQDGYRKASMVATGISDDEATRATLIAQYDNRDQVDEDNNGVSESPMLENKTITLRLSHDLTDRDNVLVRLNRTESEIFGGPDDSDISKVRRSLAADDSDTPQANLFAGGDVRNQFTGKAWETAEWIETTRDEVAVSWLHAFDSFNMTLTASHNEHEQDSFYEGFVYEAENEMTYLDARFNWSINDSHHLTFGVDNRDEELDSDTNSTSVNYVSDSFEYDTLGFYIQDTWNVNENLEIAMAVRFDSVEADFTAPQKPGTEIDERIVSPRIDARWVHDDQWTSRISAGRGFRAPLSFFESDHGLLDGDDGFDIDVDKLERSKSFSYALSYEGDKLSITGSIARTEVENLAALDETPAGVPLLTQLDKDATVLVTDIALSYPLSDELTVSATAENISYNSTFKQAFGVVPVEQRIVLSMDWEVAGWDLFASATWVGSRDLSEYGTPDAPTFDQAGTLAKDQDADAYWTLDVRASTHLNEQWEVYAGATNLTNYTQAEDMETPLFFDGGEYDVAHIYGPLRGRELYAGVKYKF